MKKLLKGLAALAALVVLAVAGAYLYMVVAPPTLLRVGSGYSAKITCSTAFVSGRAPTQAMAIDVQAPGNPILKAYSMDAGAEGVRTGFLRFVGPVKAVPRQGLGCALFPEGGGDSAPALAAPVPPGPSTSPALWPVGEGVDLTGQDHLQTLLQDETLAGPGMRAIVVVKDGRIVAERYAEGFSRATPLLGWSMTKTVTGALIGTVVKEGLLSLDQADLIPQWAGDDRSQITVAQLMSMSSGLVFNEDYGDVSDVTRMLYLEPDMAAFAASMPLEAAPGSKFNYSTGTPVILAHVWQRAVGGGPKALAWPREALFGPIGMDSALMEADATGTFVGGSYTYATARDWARFGQLLLQEGVWNGQQILPEGFVRMMQTPTEADASYGQGMTWMNGPDPDDLATPDSAFGIPEDAFWMRGHDGQSIAVIPSTNMVVVRMGLTPGRENYRSQPLVGALWAAAQK